MLSTTHQQQVACPSRVLCERAGLLAALAAADQCPQKREGLSREGQLVIGVQGRIHTYLTAGDSELSFPGFEAALLHR